MAPCEEVQPRPPTEELAQAFDQAQRFSDGEHVGYAWMIRPPMSSSSRPSQITAASGSKPRAELGRIQNEVSDLRLEGGVPGAELIYKTRPDHRDNRVVVSIKEMNEALPPGTGQPIWWRHPRGRSRSVSGTSLPADG